MSKSKACGICQARKVKCDRVKPSCSPCLKYQWKCPGYPAARDKVSHSESRARSQIPRASRSSCHVRRSPERQRRLKVVSSAMELPSARDIPIHVLAAELVGYLSLSTPPGKSLRQLGFINLVPPRLGLNDALDDAVRCLCSAYGAFLSSRPILDSCLYRRALKSLQKSLTSEAEALSCEVLCAVVCLSWCEVLTNNVDETWLVHTIGFSRLIQLRGPGQHMEGFGRALLHAEHGLLPCLSFVTHTPCFLSTPDWQAAVDSPLPFDPTQKAAGIVADHFAQSLLSHYKLMTRLSEARNAMTDCLACEPPDTAQITATLRQYRRLRDECKASLRSTSAIGSNLPNTSDSTWLSDDLSLLFCKDALGQIMVNTAMMELYSRLRNIDSPKQADNANLSRLTGFSPDIITQKGPTGMEKLLDTEVDALLELAHRSYPKAKETSPFGIRRLVATYRVVCAHARRRQGYHPVWDKIEDLITHEKNFEASL